jgi:hypothetical protein
MRRFATVVTAAAVVAAPVEGQRIPKQWLGAGVGVVVGAGFAALYGAFTELEDQGGCSEVACVAVVSVGVAGALGFLIGNEFEKKYRQRYRHAPPLSLDGVARPLAITPSDLRLESDRVLVSGSGGVELFARGGQLSSDGLWARGLRSVATAAVHRPTDDLVVGTAFGLYRFPLVVDEPGHLALPGEMSALALGPRAAAYADVFDVWLARFDGDSIVPLGEPIEESARVTDLRWDQQGRLWAVTEEFVILYTLAPSGDRLERRAELLLRTPGRNIAFVDDLALVATGSGGVIVYDGRDPETLREVVNWSGARFAYDVAAVGTAVYLAAGPEGLYVLQWTGETLESLGLVRDLGFLAGVEAGPDGVFLIDRTGIFLRRLEPIAGTQ